MSERRRYTKRTKLSAVMAAEMSGVVEAERQTGIPESTIRYWMEKPEFAQFRAKTREDLSDEIKTVAHLAWQHVAESLRSGTMEPRDAIFAAEKATSLQILMTGGATARTETRDITGSLEDTDVRDAIRAAEDLLGGSAGRATEAAEAAAEGQELRPLP
jgi:transposase-like protein